MFRLKLNILGTKYTSLNVGTNFLVVVIHSYYVLASRVSFSYRIIRFNVSFDVNDFYIRPETDAEHDVPTGSHGHRLYCI